MHPKRAEALARIKRNIDTSGFHIYLVGGGSTPRFVYTIGLRESLGAELVLAGALYYANKDDLLAIVRSVRAQLGATDRPQWQGTFAVGALGAFTLRRAHGSWTRALLLGALDYYGVEDVEAYQIVPEDAHVTIDVPDMAAEWAAEREPCWRWLRDEPWSYPVPRDAEAMTNLGALRGGTITEACRWEDDYWEMFAGAGPDIPKEDGRLVHLGWLLAADPSLLRVVELAVGEGVRRDPGGEWRDWKR